MRQPTTPEEVKKCADDPYYYYFNYLANPDQYRMTREEFDEQVKTFKEARDKQYTPEELEEIRKQQAESTFEGREDVISFIYNKVKKEVQPIKNRVKQKKEEKIKKRSLFRKKNKAAKKSRKNNRKK